jgi:hypothetical protein
MSRFPPEIRYYEVHWWKQLTCMPLDLGKISISMNLSKSDRTTVYILARVLRVMGCRRFSLGMVPLKLK